MTYMCLLVKYECLRVNEINEINLNFIKYIMNNNILKKCIYIHLKRVESEGEKDKDSFILLKVFYRKFSFTYI